VQAAGVRPHEAAPAAVQVSGAGKRFRSPRGEVVALEGLTLSVVPGERIGLVGPSGCGKSTLLELIAGLEQPDAGTVHVQGQEAARERLRRSVLMPQRDGLLPWRSALDNAALARELAGERRASARAAATELFGRFGLAGFERARPYELSGGMRQRVAFARTMLAGKPILLLDEPFAALDAITRAEMQEWLLGALADETRTVVLVTHDVEEALYLCDRVAVLSPRPGSVRAYVDGALPGADRTETVTSPEFTERKQRALEALR
jgi:ABC-type nitrate/sulfonate/bicarbonate transport system ATPase subunit